MVFSLLMGGFKLISSPSQWENLYSGKVLSFERFSTAYPQTMRFPLKLTPKKERINLKETCSQFCRRLGSSSACTRTGID
jgi:hypothetical protein